MKNYNVCGFLDNSTVNGEGLRSVIFFAGCPHHCLGCQNEAFQDKHSGVEMSENELLNKIKGNIPYIKGVTFSGGEPFEQDSTSLMQSIHDLGLTLWVYTGYTYEQLQSEICNRPYIRSMLELTDVLVDGKFDISLIKDAPLYTGSTNQRFLLLENGKPSEIRSSYCERKR